MYYLKNKVRYLKPRFIWTPKSIQLCQCVRKVSVITQKMSRNDAFHLAQIPNLSPKSCLVFADLISPSPLLIRHICMYQTLVYYYSTAPTAATVLQVLVCFSSSVSVYPHSALKSGKKCHLGSRYTCLSQRHDINIL